MSDWPRPGDSLNNPGVDPKSEALLGAGEDWISSYASSFKEAADVVVGGVENHTTSPDAVGYAVCYLYRHYIELILKGLIGLGYNLGETPNDFPSLGRNAHDLTELWRVSRALLEELFPEGDKKETDVVEKCIREIVEIDGGRAQRLRYGADSQGNDLWWAADRFVPVQLSLPNLRDVMNRLSGFLSGSYDAMDELLQCQQDLYSESDE